MSAPDGTPTAVRLALADRVAAEARERLGPACLAVAAYGSVAHGAARQHSDLELVVLTSDGVAAQEIQSVRGGILVELDILAASRMLEAAGRVTAMWGLEADQYRVFSPLHDPDQWFPRVRARSESVPPQAFAQPLEDNQLRLLEVCGKFFNAAEEGDAATMRDVGWRYAHAAALRVALLQMRPYDSGRTLWRDARTRGFELAGLLDALTEEPTGHLAAHVHRVNGALNLPWPLAAEGR